MGLKISRQESIYRFCLSRFVFGKEICLASYLSTTKYNAVFIRLEQYQLLFKGYKKLDNRELINQLWLVFNSSSLCHRLISVVRIDGSVPLKYGLRLNLDDKYRTLKRELAELCNLSAEQLLLVEIAGAMVKVRFTSSALRNHLVKSPYGIMSKEKWESWFKYQPIRCDPLECLRCLLCELNPVIE